MKIQEAVKACSKTPDTFARPVSWKGTGIAVDLAKRMRQDRVTKMTFIREGTAWGSEWAISPEDLLDRWEIVSMETLAAEANSGSENPE